MVLADAAVISVLALAQQHLVPGVLIPDSTTWMLPLACTSVYILQIALPPWLGLPGPAIVVIAYGLGTGHLATAWLLVGDDRRRRAGGGDPRGRPASGRVVAAGLETEQHIRAEEARRADEREQHRQLHDTVLSTLTMVAARAFAEPSPALTAQAARDQRVLQGLAGAPAAPCRAGWRTHRPEAEAGAGRGQHRRPGRAAELVPVTLPSPVAEQLVACVGEALRNVARHAGTGQAEVTVTGGAAWAIVKITDRGRGFDPAATPPSRRGIRESITGRMLAAGAGPRLPAVPARARPSP